MKTLSRRRRKRLICGGRPRAGMERGAQEFVVVGKFVADGRHRASHARHFFRRGSGRVPAQGLLPGHVRARGRETQDLVGRYHRRPRRRVARADACAADQRAPVAHDERPALVGHHRERTCGVVGRAGGRGGVRVLDVPRARHPRHVGVGVRVRLRRETPTARRTTAFRQRGVLLRFGPPRRLTAVLQHDALDVDGRTRRKGRRYS